MNSSFTIWYKGINTNSDKPTLDLHINLWINNTDKRDSIDFGIMIKKPNLIKELYFYIPFNISENDINNLITLLSKDKDSSSLVFNEDITLGNKVGEIINVKRGEEEFQYYLINSIILDELDEVKLKNGKILKFNFDSNIDEKNKYIRFRISNIQNKGLVEYYPKSVSYLSGSYNILSSMEINFNEFRKLPENIYQKAHHNHIGITLVNLFVMTDIHMEYIFSNIKNVKSRILEKEKWEEYNYRLKNTKNDKILAYQFKEKSNSIDDVLKGFSIFAKFNSEGARKSNIFLALIVAILLGIIGSVSASYINLECPKNYIKKESKK